MGQSTTRLVSRTSTADFVVVVYVATEPFCEAHFFSKGLAIVPTMPCLQARGVLPACFESYDHKQHNAMKSEAGRYADIEVCVFVCS